MAPFQGPGRGAAVELLTGLGVESKLPITLGRNQPQAIIDVVDDAWVLRELELDAARANAEGKARLARGESWMPEMTWQFLEPGEVLLSAGSSQALAQLIGAMKWPYGPE